MARSKIPKQWKWGVACHAGFTDMISAFFFSDFFVRSFAQLNKWSNVHIDPKNYFLVGFSICISLNDWLVIIGVINHIIQSSVYKYPLVYQVACVIEVIRGNHRKKKWGRTCSTIPGGTLLQWHKQMQLELSIDNTTSSPIYHYGKCSHVNRL